MTIRTKENHIRINDVNLQTRELKSDEQTEERVIEGYFSVFNSETELFPGGFEEIAPTAFNDTLDNDIKALINHNQEMVLGRTKSDTLQLKVDGKGLYGVIKINEHDTDAVNLYERVKRGDVDQCSFGFRVVKEEEEIKDDGSVKWRVTKADLKEVSVVTFPAYEDTSIQARMKQKEQMEERKLDKKKIKLRKRLENVKTIND